ncbi:MAG: apolipoprotein N-acyltransferase [Planctomycetes bacterium]|nr:apolipoprotein N-acyltransferase [Planctomycetota bacterium]
MKTWTLVLTALASAVCTLLSSAPYGFGLAAIAAPLCLLVIALRAKTIRSALCWIFIFQLPLWLWLHSWVAVVAFAGWLGLGFYMSIWAPLFVLAVRYVRPKTSISMVVYAPTLWVGLECIRGIVLFDGYPWYLAGTGILDWPIVSIASAGSVWSASFLVVALSAALANFRSVRCWTWASLVVVCAFFFIKGLPLEMESGASMNVAVIQTNVSQSNKVAWSWKSQLEEVSQAITMTKKATLNQEAQPSLLIWPETMLPGSGFEVKRNDFAPWVDSFAPYWVWPEKILEVASELKTPILIGTQTHMAIEIVAQGQTLHPEITTIYNSAVLVAPNGTTERYDKIFLTPFGERIPYLSIFPALQEWVRDSFGAAMLFNVDVGGAPHRFTMQCDSDEVDTTAEITFATPICFEDTVPSVIRDLVWVDGKRVAGALINLSNDGWFSDDDGARLQHVREARMRCIENKTPMVRAANTGLSCLIDASGRVQKSAMVDGKIAVRQKAILHATIFEGSGKPLSRFVGDAVAWLSLIGGILLVLKSYYLRSKVYEKQSKNPDETPSA